MGEGTRLTQGHTASWQQSRGWNSKSHSRPSALPTLAEFSPEARLPSCRPQGSRHPVVCSGEHRCRRPSRRLPSPFPPPPHAPSGPCSSASHFMVGHTQQRLPSPSCQATAPVLPRTGRGNCNPESNVSMATPGGPDVSLAHRTLGQTDGKSSNGSLAPGVPPGSGSRLSQIKVPRVAQRRVARAGGRGQAVGAASRGSGTSSAATSRGPPQPVPHGHGEPEASPNGRGDRRGRYTALGTGPGTSCGTCWPSTCATLSHLRHQARRGGLGQSQRAGNPTDSEQLWLMSLEQTLSRSGL